MRPPPTATRGAGRPRTPATTRSSSGRSPTSLATGGEVLGRTDRQFRAASGPQDFAGGLHDMTGGYPRRVHGLRGGSGARETAKRQVHDTGRVTCIVERFEHRAADTAGRVVVLNDDESVPS